MKSRTGVAILLCTGAVLLASASQLPALTGAVRQTVDPPAYAGRERPDRAALERRLRAGSGVRGLSPAAQYALAERAVFRDGPHTIPVSGDATMTYGEGLLVWAGFSPVLILPGTSRDTSPDSQGTLGIFYLRDRGDGFEISQSWPDAIGGSGLGQPPQWYVTTDMMEEPAVISTASSLSQGIDCAVTTITGLEPAAPGELVTFRSGYDDSGAAQEGAAIIIEGRVTNVVKGQSFDVLFTGSRTFTHHFRRTFDSFARPQGDGTEELPSC